MLSRSKSTLVTFTIHGRTRRGALDILPSLPLDLLCEIFCFLHPVDLLVLSRTSKAFRSFLLRRSSIFVWRSARRNLDNLPEPPSDTNEVQYAWLVFGSACNYKGCDRKARDTVWHLRIRSCAGCRPKHQPVKVYESNSWLDLCKMLDCCPDAIEQYIPCGPFLNSKGNPIKGFQESHIQAFKNELIALPVSDRQAYLDRCRQATEKTSQFASAGVAWQMDVKSMRITALRNKRAARAEIIHESLVAIGFKEEIDYFGWDRIRRHPLISSTQAMTDQGIHSTRGQSIALTLRQARSSVMDQLRKHMLDWRELRMEEQVYASRRRVFVDAWLRFTITAFHSVPDDYPYFPLPPCATVGFFESIDSVIRQPMPVSHGSLLQQLYATFPLAREYILEWQKTVRRQLASLLPDYRAEDGDDAIHAKLRLATSVFHCNTGRNCRDEGRTLSYPEILFHPCFTLVVPGNRPSLKDPRNIANQKACLTMGGRPWRCNGRVQVHPKQCVVERVLMCCGKDPGSTTSAEMDRQDPRLLCLECAVLNRRFTSMSWRRAVQHYIMFHPNSTNSCPWLMASPMVRARIDRLESPKLRPFSSMSGATLGDYSVCLLCPPCIPSWNTRFGFADLTSHMQNNHGVPSPAFGRDYVFDTNITPVYLDPVIIRW